MYEWTNCECHTFRVGAVALHSDVMSEMVLLAHHLRYPEAPRYLRWCNVMRLNSMTNKEAQSPAIKA